MIFMTQDGIGITKKIYYTIKRRRKAIKQRLI